MMATHPIIASEFNALRDSTWLLTSFGLAGAAMQPLVNLLSGNPRCRDADLNSMES
jgi:hypothetical protein